MSLLHSLWVFVRFVVAWIYSLATGILCCVLCVTVGPRRMWLLVCRFWARTVLGMVGVRLAVEGAEHLRGPAIFISNHQSLIDVVFMPAILPGTVKFVAKRELLFIPFWGWAFAAGGAILIDRKRPKAAVTDLYNGVKAMPPNWSVAIFPEGTRSRDGAVRHFKRGAFALAAQTGLPIVPIGMDGARDVVPPEGWLVRGGEVRVVVGQPLRTDGWRMDTLHDHVQEGQRAVEACVARAIARRQPSEQPPHKLHMSLSQWER